jgi:hypothetical protein
MTASGAGLPVNARIVVVAAGTDPWSDRVADDLARRLHERGWWVDRPNLAAAGDAARLADRIGGTPHAVVGVDPRADHVLGLLRRSGALSAPVVSCPAGPEVRGSCRAGGADAVLSPYPAVDRLLRSLPGGVSFVAVDGVGIGSLPGANGRGTGRTRVVVPAWAADARRTAQVVRDLASWGTWPLVMCGENHAAARRVDALGVGTSLLGDPGQASAVAAADVVVDPTGGRAGWPAVLAGRRVICYRVPRSAQAVAAALHDAGVAVWARTRTDLGLALAEAVDPVPVVSSPRLDPVAAIEAVAGVV